MNDVKGISCISGYFVNTASGMTKAALAAAENMKGEYASRDAGFCSGEDTGWSVFSRREYSCVWHIFRGCAQEILALQAVLQRDSRYRRYGTGRRFPWHRIQKNRLLKIHLLTRALPLVSLRGAIEAGKKTGVATGRGEGGVMADHGLKQAISMPG